MDSFFFGTTWDDTSPKNNFPNVSWALNKIYHLPVMKHGSDNSQAITCYKSPFNSVIFQLAMFDDQMVLSIESITNSNQKLSWTLSTIISNSRQ
jgi:hypothetical protein